MYQSQQSQINTQCFQHLAPHTDKLLNQQFSDFSSGSVQQHLLLRTVATADWVGPVLLSVEPAFICQGRSSRDQVL